MSECTHNCETCGENCSERKKPESFLEKPHELSKIKKVQNFCALSTVNPGNNSVGRDVIGDVQFPIFERRFCGRSTESSRHRRVHRVVIE